MIRTLGATGRMYYQHFMDYPHNDIMVKYSVCVDMHSESITDFIPPLVSALSGVIL